MQGKLILLQCSRLKEICDIIYCSLLDKVIKVSNEW